jgi:hypothetical protein
MMTWYFNNDGTADGPHDESAMLTLIQAGRVSTSTLIWHERHLVAEVAATFRPLETGWQSPHASP